MSVKLQVYLRKAKRKMIKKWYQMMKPLAKHLTKREDKKRKISKDKITEYEATKLIAKEMVKYIIKYNQNMYLVIADFMNDDDCSGYVCLKYIRGSMIKRDKAKTAYYKFDRTVEFQEKVLDEVRKIKGVTVEELDEKFTWEDVRNHQGTYKISIDGSGE